MDLFEGSDKIYSLAWPKGNVKPNGKEEYGYKAIHAPITRQNYDDHFNGKSGIVVFPITEKGLVKFAAIDIDVYKEGIRPDEIIAQFRSKGLKLVPARTASGGLHLYIFLTEWISAITMMEKMSTIASFLGYASAEVFPKQAIVGKANGLADYGNGIKIPYQDGKKLLRTGYDFSGAAIPEIDDFIEFALENRYTPEEFEAIKFEQIQPDQTYPEGPPCLNAMLAQKDQSGFRNELLFMAGTMFKKSHNEGWQAPLEQLNAQLSNPLPAKELTSTVITSHKRHEYAKYPCKKSPFKNYCDSYACRKRKFGVSDEPVWIVPKSLSKIMTDPPIYMMDLEVDGDVKRVEMSHEELFNNRLFRQKVMSVVDRLLPAMKDQQWSAEVNELLRHLSIVDIPYEMSMTGQLHELVEGFITVALSDEVNMNTILRGGVYERADKYCFRLKDLQVYIKANSEIPFKQNYITSFLKMRCNALSQRERIEGDNVRFITIDKRSVEINKQKLTSPEIPDNEPF